jgi:hypothetical protein
MHLTDRCRFLNFSVRMGGGGENKRGGGVGGYINRYNQLN